MNKIKNVLKLVKEGSKAALIALIINAVIAIIKGIAAYMEHDVVMYAEMFHSISDATIQLGVFAGTVLAAVNVSEKFPQGMGRMVNVTCFVAVVASSIMAFHNIEEGFHFTLHPENTSGPIVLSLIVLTVANLLEGSVWFKAGGYILKEADVKVKNPLLVIPTAFKYLKNANAATKMVFLEDAVATTGGILAQLAILIGTFTPLKSSSGVASVIIGVLMMFVLFKIARENLFRIIGEAVPEELTDLYEHLVMSNPEVRKVVKDIEITGTYEGDEQDLVVRIEVDKEQPYHVVDDAKDLVEKILLEKEQVLDVIVETDEQDDIQHYKFKEKEAI